MRSRTDGDEVRAESSGKNSRASTSSPERGQVDQEPAPTANVKDSNAPPLPSEALPPLPKQAPPAEDDGWDPVWDENAQAFYFYNRFTQHSQWTNPRVPDATQGAPGTGIGKHDRIPERAPGTDPPLVEHEAPREKPPEYTGYNPAIHGDYDPTAPYAQKQSDAPLDPSDPASEAAPDPGAIYAATGTFNRFTGKWQASHINPENHNDEAKSNRQMTAFFDVDKAANSHQGKSLKAERAGKKLSKQELKAFKEKRKERKEEKRRAWLRD
ncbi:uncharacterized protein KY384_005178 [Bacidia gigantensis]|uniref:uncharacterized protein n=1 Tax=Bacidia gigantensis TaxID=2732470 RepID=UPI001D04EF2D|nr:uncharacterized protein KY384_005178 [Bacidia gigantensis]KAG8529697.1 hypothetical protein KY384_005178 [Bacidia gigantensis]